MQKHLNRREQIGEITRAVIETYGQLAPKLEHLDPTPLPNKSSVIQIIDDILEIIYPGYFGTKHIVKSDVRKHVSDLIDSVYKRLTEEIYRSIRPECDQSTERCTHCHERAENKSIELLGRIPDLRQQLSEDVQAGYDGDPAAKSNDEVIFSYPAIYTISIYRVAHELNQNGVPLLPRIMTEHAHSKTGIDIHPGAQIGRAFFIDHGTGVVIGETTIIGERVKLYQGVTIGALSFAKDEKGELVRGQKRHPTLESDVIVYSGATILGGETVIGEGSIIGGNVWLTRSIPPHTRVMISEPQLIIDKK